MLVQELSIEQFRSEVFSQIGSDLWRSFALTAKTLATAESKDGIPYPQHESLCLLCQQPLSTHAHELLHKLWGFLENASQTEREKIAYRLLEEESKFNSARLNFWNAQTVSHRHIATLAPEILAKIDSYVKSCGEQRASILKALQARQPTESPLMSPSNPKDAIEAIIKKLSTTKDNLLQRNPAEEIASLERQKLELEHRDLLKQKMPDIELYLSDRNWRKTASSSKVMRNTTHITRKHNELFKLLVTDQYIALFEATLKKLNCPLRVKVQTKGQRGATLKQLVLEADTTMAKIASEPDKILSEGEQRAVALADFLTEAALDTSSTGLILDDPVTSLDFTWKDTIATQLTEEAKSRQVIVFTHDLHFLYCLKINAERIGLNTEAHWIQNRNNKPGWVFLDNSPALEQDYKKLDKPRKFLELAKSAPAEEQETLLRNGFGALRTCYEAFVMFDLFNQVIQRFSEPIMFMRLRGVVYDQQLIDETVEKFEFLSRYIEGHSHSDQFSAIKPTPDDLSREIGHLEGLRRRLREIKKNAGIKN